jgi:hypothetical protein
MIRSRVPRTLALLAAATALAAPACGSSASRGEPGGGPDAAEDRPATSSDDASGSDGAGRGDSTFDAPAGDSTIDGAPLDGAPADGAPFDSTALDSPAPGDGPSDAMAEDALGADTGEDGTGATDSGLPQDGGPPCDLSTASAACTSNCNSAPPVGLGASTGDAPTPTGGSVAPGVYHLTAITYYYPGDASIAGLAASTTQQTLIVTAARPVGTMELIRSDDGAANLATSFEYAAGAPDLYLTSTCPSAGQTIVGYTATSSEIELFVQQSGGPSDPYLSVGDYALVGPYSGRALVASDAAPPDEAGRPDAGCGASDTQGCNTLCTTGMLVTTDAVAASPPDSWSGGSIADGTYELVSNTEYDGAGSGADGGPVGTLRETVFIATSNGVSVWQDVQSVDGGASTTSTFAAFPSGSDLYVTGACPSVTQETYRFTYANGEIHLLRPAAAGPATVAVYARL